MELNLVKNIKVAQKKEMETRTPITDEEIEQAYDQGKEAVIMLVHVANRHPAMA